MRRLIALLSLCSALLAAAASPARAGDEGATYVLSIGIDACAEPAKVPPLRSAERDARGVFGFFAGTSRSPARAECVAMVSGADATRAAVLAAIRERLAARATGPKDTAILYLACRGSTDASGSWLLGSDARPGALAETAIPLAALEAAWAEVRAGRKLLVADVFRGPAGGLGAFSGFGAAPAAPSGTAAPAGYSVTIVPCASGEAALETETGRGVLGSLLVSGLKGDADLKLDGAIDDAEMEKFLVKQVAAATGGKQRVAFRRSGKGAVLLSNLREEAPDVAQTPPPPRPRPAAPEEPPPAAQPKLAPAGPAPAGPAPLEPVSGYATRDTCAIGAPPPEVEAAGWINGAGYSLRQAVGHRIVVIEIWATWCPYCVKSIPLLNDLAARYATDVDVVSLTDEDRSTVLGFTSKTQVSYAIGYGCTMSRRYPGGGVPRAFLVGADGRLLWTGNPLGGSLEKAIQYAIAQKARLR